MAKMLIVLVDIQVRFLPEAARDDIVLGEVFNQDFCLAWGLKMNGCQSMTVTSFGSSAGVWKLNEGLPKIELPRASRNVECSVLHKRV